MVTAESATRFPRAGGEYVVLREVCGEFAACFFWWTHTIFVIGGKAAAITPALGELGCALPSVPPGTWTEPPAVARRYV